MAAADEVNLPPHVEEVVAALTADLTVLEIWLIGSRASGSYSPTSDWDLLVQSGREFQSRPRRHQKVDIIWCGPSGICQVESDRDYYPLQFNDFEWELVDPATASYTAKKFIDYDPEVGRDTSEPVFATTRQRALLLWRRESA